MIGETHKIRLSNNSQKVFIEKGKLFIDSYGEVFRVDGIGVSFEEDRIFLSGGFGEGDAVELLLESELNKTVSVLEVITRENNFKKVNYTTLEGGELVIVVEDYHSDGIEVKISPTGDIFIDKYPHA